LDYVYLQQAWVLRAGQGEAAALLLFVAAPKELCIEKVH